MNKNIVACITLLICVHQLKAQSADCTKYEWACHSNECIPFSKFCDGRKDCADGSDETSEACGKNICRRHSFQCSYGACIDSTAKCNGVQDCADNSDEIASTCVGIVTNSEKETTISLNKGKIWVLPFSTIQINKITSNVSNVLNVLQADKSDLSEIRPESPKTPVVPTTSNPLSTGCTIGALDHGIIILKTNLTELKAGAYVDAFTYIEYKCKGKYVLEGPKINICEGGKWSFSQPKCSIYCPAPDHGYTIKHECEVNGVKESCFRRYDDWPIGSIINNFCQWGYRKPKGDFPEQMLCQSNGEWDKSPTRCEYTCGTLSTSDDHEMNTTLLSPWHLAIHKKTEKNWFKEFCAGTSLSPKLAISVAHCFWDSETATLVDLSDIQILTGKYYPTYQSKAEETADYLVASDVYIPQAYKDNQSQQDDIALLVIKYPLFLRPQSLPICLDFTNDNNILQSMNTIGRIAARGRDSNCEVRSYIDVPVVDNTKCTSKDDQIVEKTVMKDQFCVGEVNELCLMDGEGYAVPKWVDGQKIYFLEGVVGRNISKEGTSGSYAVVISIHKYLSVIQEYLIPEQAEI